MILEEEKMGIVNRTGRMTGKGKLYAVLATTAAAAAVLFYLEHLAVIYISAAVFAFVILILAAFSGVEEASIHASKEAYMTRSSDGDISADHAGNDEKGSVTPRRRAAAVVLGSKNS